MELPKVNAFVLCENIILDQQNRYSLINIYNQFRFPTFPVVFPLRMFLSYISPEGFFKLQISLTKPGKSPEQIFESDSFQGLPENIDGFMDFAIQFDQPGPYLFTASLSGKPFAELNLSVFEVQS